MEHDWARHHVRSLVLRSREGETLSSLRLYAVRGLHRDTEIRLGGIGEVLTPEELRGRGYASRLLRLTLELLEHEGIDGAYLFSDIDPDFYSRFGFVAICSKHVDVSIDRMPEAPAGGPDIRSRRPADWAAIGRIHRAAGEGEPLWLLRDDEQWGFLLGRWPLWARHDPRYRIVPLDFVVELEGRVCGYAIALAETEERTLRLLEFGTELGDPSALQALLGALRKGGSDLGCVRFRGPWPPGAAGSAFREIFKGVPRADAVFMSASLNARFDLSEAVRQGLGFWETDHI
jgi:predicted GNAT family N-acyltransferase